MRGNSGDSDKKVNLLITLLVNIQSTPIKNRGTPTNAQVHPIRFAGVYRNNNTYVLEVFAGKFAVPRNPKFTRHKAPVLEILKLMGRGRRRRIIYSLCDNVLAR